MTRFIIGGVTGCAFVDDQIEVGAFGLFVGAVEVLGEVVPGVFGNVFDLRFGVILLRSEVGGEFELVVADGQALFFMEFGY